jgi:hypothetical protein
MPALEDEVEHADHHQQADQEDDDDDPGEDFEHRGTFWRVFARGRNREVSVRLTREELKRAPEATS